MEMFVEMLMKFRIFSVSKITSSQLMLFILLFQYVGSVRVVAFQHDDRLELIKQHMERYRVSLFY